MAIAYQQQLHYREHCLDRNMLLNFFNHFSIFYTPELSFAVVILSSPDIVSGETYTITVGSASGEFEAY